MLKIALLGAGGAVGQPLSLLLRLSPLIDTLTLYDRHLAPGVAVDLSHIPCSHDVHGYTAADAGLARALENADIVIVAAGPGITSEMASRDALFQQSALVMPGLVKSYARSCPRATMLVVTNPINAIVPYIAELLRAHGVFDARRLFGVTTLDIVRAETFLAEAEGGGVVVGDRRVDVIGGHSPQTMVPLLSLAQPAARVGGMELEGVANRVRFGGREIIYAKERNGAAALSTAYAVLRFAEAVCRGLRGEKGVVECAYVHLPGIEGGDGMAEELGVGYFAVPVEFDVGNIFLFSSLFFKGSRQANYCDWQMHGASRVVDLLGTISPKDQLSLQIAIPFLRQNIKTGLDAAKDYLSREKS